MFLNCDREGTRFWTEWQQQFTQFDLLYVSSCIKFSFVGALPNYLNCAASDLITAPLNNVESFNFFSLKFDSFHTSGYENVLPKSLSAPLFFLPIKLFP
jgi:hypothetical protein